MAGSTWLYGLFLGCIAVGPASGKVNGSMAKFMDSLLSRESYDRRVRPGLDDGPTVVDVDLFFNSISSINDVAMEYSGQVFLRQRWTDPRLAFVEHDDSIFLTYQQFDQLWVPDLFVTNEKDGNFHDLTVPNRLVEIGPSGRVLYSQRLTFILSCDMSLANYPMDNQTCTFNMESYGFTTRDLIFRWNLDKTPVTVRKGLKLPEFELTSVNTGNCTAEYSTGSFTCIFAELHLQREFAYYLIQTYIPSILIVMLSWVSFWIDIHAVPARISLGLLTVLTMTTQSSGISARLPRVSYIKAIDVWMTTCLAFVFGALIEYSIVNVLARKQQRNDAKKKGAVKETDADLGQINLALEEKDSSAQSNEENNPNRISAEHKEQSVRKRHLPNASTVLRVTDPVKKRNKKLSWWQKVRNNRALKVDVLSRILFPSVFIAFNLFYWLYYES